MKSKNIDIRKISWLVLSLFALPAIGIAQEAEVATTVSYFSNALFNTLLVTIILLAMLIVALSGVLKNITSSEMFIDKLKKRRERQSGKTGAAASAILLSLLSVTANAQSKIQVVDDRIGGIDQFTFYFMLTIIAVELIFITVMLFSIQMFLKSEEVLSATTANKPKEKTIFDKLSDAVDVENEESIMLDHDYDGIKELDNNLPPWWKYGFYLTIVIAVIYILNYHILRTAPLQAQEYTLSVKQAEAEIAEYMKTSANNVDENTVKLLTDASDLAAGKDVFVSMCAACHGKLGEGTVGPNLTDDYWLHSGGIKDIFKTIKYGWPDKGMKSWKDELSPMQIAQLTSYIKSLRGTNPPKGKEKQGELYAESATNVPSDSLAVVSDSLKAAMALDTVQNKVTK